MLGAFFALMYGNTMGLSKVETDRWGGLPLTILLASLSLVMSFPLALLIALVQGILPLVGAARNNPAWIAVAKPAGYSSLIPCPAFIDCFIRQDNYRLPNYFCYKAVGIC